MDNDFRRQPLKHQRQLPQAPFPEQPPVQPSPPPGVPPLAPPEPLQPATVRTPVAPPPLKPVEPPKASKSSKIKKLILWLIVSVVFVGALLTGGAWWWYQSQLAPVNRDSTDTVRVTIEPNTTPDAIAAQLKEAALIRSTEAFAIYTRLTGTQNLLQAGSYRLSPSESTPEIVGHLTKGNVDTVDITFLPGATLAQHKEVLIKAGYSEDEVDKAFEASYSSPLFKGREMADLEGYIYGETYKVSSGATVGEILQMTFAEFASVIEENDLENKFTEQGLTLREGIILASIIQREAGGGDEAQIAQVFLTRKAQDMVLGSDVTYQYIADKTGVPRDVNLDSPYNTRRYPGLPPGPISSPGLNALLGVASPARGDYLYFLSGDDNKTYYAHTLEEHEANIANHCRQKCQII